MMCLAVKLSSASKSLLTTIANRNYRAKSSCLILLKKIRKFAENKQTNKQTDREFKYRPLLSPVDRWGERANFYSSVCCIVC